MKIFSDHSDKLRYEFLPAAEEIVETPPSPFGRIVLWSTIILLAVAFLWSYFGKIDVVTTAQGKITPEGDVKIIQPSAQSSISAIKVSEGEKVKKGQTLVELDTTVARSALDVAERSLAIATLERDILKALDKGQDTTGIISASTVSDEIKNDLNRLATSRRSVADIRRGLLSISINDARAQLDAQQQTLADTESNLRDLQNKKLEMEQRVTQATDANRADLETQLQDITNQIASAQNTIKSQNQQIARARTSVDEAKSNLDNYNAETSTNQLLSVVDQDKKITELEDSIVKAKKNLEAQTLISPVDGTVLSLATKTIGGVVSPAQPLITIVPSDAKLVIEAYVTTADIGFVKVGQKVVVKVDAFSFQRYGYLSGKVESISADALQDEKRGYVYKTKISVDNTNTSKSNSLQIVPGMTVTNEVTTGQRRIIEFFLDPLISHTNESLKVR